MVMYLLSLKECFEKRLLKKGEKSLRLAKKSLKQATFFLNEAQDLIELGKEQIATLSLYNAYFHTTRALLYKDGIKEKSHYCIARYLEEKYIKEKKIDIKFLNAFETVMNIRHNIQYSTEKVEIDEDLTELSNICEELILKIERILKE